MKTMKVLLFTSIVLVVLKTTLSFLPNGRSKCLSTSFYSKVNSLQKNVDQNILIETNSLKVTNYESSADNRLSLPKRIRHYVSRKLASITLAIALAFISPYNAHARNTPTKSGGVVKGSTVKKEQDMKQKKKVDVVVEVKDDQNMNKIFTVAGLGLVGASIAATVVKSKDSTSVSDELERALVASKMISTETEPRVTVSREKNEPKSKTIRRSGKSLFN
jgi:hypothetical protein